MSDEPEETPSVEEDARPEAGVERTPPHPAQVATLVLAGISFIALRLLDGFLDSPDWLWWVSFVSEVLCAIAATWWLASAWRGHRKVAWFPLAVLFYLVLVYGPALATNGLGPR